MVAVSRQAVMTLFSGPSCPYSHRIRLVIAEKGVAVEIQQLGVELAPENLKDLNPYGMLPTLVDRELTLYESRVIGEYLDERFPHPPLLPMDPASRAKARLVLFRLERDWYRRLHELDESQGKAAETLRAELAESIASSENLFAGDAYFLSEDFTLMDCAVAPVLWRLPHYGVELPAAAADYAERIFARESFQSSLSAAERAMRD